MEARLRRIGWAAALVVLGAAAADAAAAEPEVLFDLKAEKRIEEIFLVGDNEDYIVVANEEQVWAYDANSGRELWSDEVPGHTGMKLVWGSRYYVASLKKGMRCYEVATGRVVWETQTELKMKDYVQSFSFDSGFVLRFGNSLTGFDPNTGAVKWSSDRLDWNGKLIEKDIPVIWEFDEAYGARLLVLGDKVSQVVDAASGALLGTVELKLDDKITEPVAMIGTYGVALFGKDETRGIDLRTGAQMWAVDEKVDRRRGYLTFEQAERHYALFSFKKSILLLDMDSGQKLWETPEELAMKVQAVHLYDDGLLLAVGVKNYHTPNNDFGNRGGFTLAMGFELATGTLRYQTLLAYATQPTVEVPFLGFTWQSIVKAWFTRPEGALFFCFGNEGRSIGAMGSKWENKGGEGFVLMDPATGQVKWRNDLVVWETWRKPLQQAGDYKDYTGPRGGSPGEFDDLEETPVPVIDGSYGYLNANQTIVKVDLRTGALVWQGPEIGFASHYQVADGRVFGEVGYSRWTYATKKDKGEDVILKSKENGYFVLDDASGQGLLVERQAKVPLDLFLHEYVPAARAVLLCDGQQLRCLDLATGAYRWELSLKRDLTGELTAEQGVAFVLTAKSSSYSSGLYSWSITTTRSYEISWAHGIHLLPDGTLLVVAKDGPALVDMQGAVRWRAEWDWKPNEVSLVPTLTPRGILYQYKKKMLYLSLADGSTLWESREKEAKDTDIFLDAGMRRIFIIEKEKNIACYRI